MTQILVTGGSGYVGSHCVLELLKNNYEVIVIDSLINSIILNGQTLPESLRRVEIITGKSIRQFYLGSIEDGDLLDKIFSQHQIEVVMHFAALKSVNESIAKALLYYRNNVSGAITLLSTMEKYGVKKFIFSSSATVYGSPNYLPLDECHPIGRTCTNPYGKSKYMIEEILNDLHNSDPEWSIISLRYFNPVGAHHSGLIGEHPQGIPNNLMPYISQVAVKMRSHLNIFGNDYNTVDGTALRDYIHIDDLIIGHLLALKCILSVKQFIGYQPINLGCGQGISVLQVKLMISQCSNFIFSISLSDGRRI